MFNKYKHICVICRRSLGTQVAGIANRQQACPPQIGKIVLISFPPQQWTLITYSSVAYLNTLPAGLCFKPLEYILINIFKESNVCFLCDTIPLHCFRDQI